ncbi:MAG: glycoside hydrolase family 127 protein [Verrucomicrobiae bacterium]|nr:glycoside hydrolase family 127 protein [Verrucomicrobiae bacterium]
MRFSLGKIYAVFAGFLACVGMASAEPVTVKVVRAAEPFPLPEVRLLDGPFRDAMLRDQKYLLTLDPDRLLRSFRVNVGLPTDAKPYGGWEAPDCELRGHSLGHYLSALSLMYASTGDGRFKKRADYIVGELAKCQSHSPAAGFHEGYLSAFPESFMDRLEQGQRVWAPWYTLHKIMAGLLEANQRCGNAQALEVLTQMADWVKFHVDHLTPEQMQKSLDTEHGGMNEVLANLYAVTGNTNYLRVAEAFNHQKVFAPLARGEDKLDRLHANTQIPKIIGATREYELTGDAQFLTVAQTFWNAVALHRSYVIGGDSDHEHFFPTNDFGQHLGTDTAETCNTYNMLKLTRELFALEPDAVKMDFYERALYNDILGSQDPETGMFTYFMSLKPGHFKVYSTPENSFWCCIGTGMENHSKYGDTIYFHAADSLYVNLFIASELNWAEKGVSVRQETKFPESGITVLKIKAERPVVFALKIRQPAWAADGLKISVNGSRQKIKSAPGSYLAVQREWHDGDTVKIQLPMKLHTEFLPGTTNEVALLYGPIVLAGELGNTAMPNPMTPNQTDYSRLPAPAVPMLVSAPADLLRHVKPSSGRPLTFRTHGIGRPVDVTLIPFYELHRQRYSVYWKLISEADWKVQAAGIAATEASRMSEEARVVDVVRPGEPQSETDHKMQGEDTQTGDFYGRKWRHAAGWFSYEMKVLSGQPQQLVATFWGSDAGARAFDVLVDGKIIGTQKLGNSKAGEFFDVVFSLPPELTQDKQSITVKFAAHPGNLAGGLYGLRVLRANITD